MNSDIPFYFVVAFAGIPFLLGLLMFAHFAFKFFGFVREVQKIYRKHGVTWDFWTDRRKQMMLALQPESILLDEPGIADLAKKNLVAHRLLVKKYLSWTYMISFGGFALAILLLLGIAAMRS